MSAAEFAAGFGSVSLADRLQSSAFPRHSHAFFGQFHIQFPFLSFSFSSFSSFSSFASLFCLPSLFADRLFFAKSLRQPFEFRSPRPASSHQRRKSSDFSSRNRSAVASQRNEEASECMDWKEERGVDVDFRADRSIHRESSRIHSTYGRFIGESIESSSLFLLFMQDALCLPCVSLDSSRFAFLNNAAAR